MNLIFKLPKEQQHTECPRCNFVGCGFARAKDPRVGHWVWFARYWAGRLSPRRAFFKLKKRLTAFDLSKVSDVEVEGIDHGDYPRFCDAFVSAATYRGRPMSDAELERLNDDEREFVHEQVCNWIY